MASHGLPSMLQAGNRYSRHHRVPNVPQCLPVSPKLPLKSLARRDHSQLRAADRVRGKGLHRQIRGKEGELEDGVKGPLNWLPVPPIGWSAPGEDVRVEF
jgi:hypothetical protein